MAFRLIYRTLLDEVKKEEVKAEELNESEVKEEAEADEEKAKKRGLYTSKFRSITNVNFHDSIL